MDILTELEAELPTNQVQNKLIKDSSNKTFIKLMSKQDIDSYLFIPVIVNNEFRGFIGFANCIHEDLFTRKRIGELQAFAGTLGHFIFNKKNFGRAIRNQRKYKQLISNIEDVVFKLDADLNLTYLNGTWFKMMGRHSKDCIGVPLIQFFTQAESEKIIREIQNLDLNGEIRASFITPLKKMSGKSHHIRVNLKKAIKAGKVNFFGTVNDVHQSQIRLSLLKAHESKFKALFDKFEDVLYSLDFNTRQLSIISDKIERFGFKRE